jgi:hypothetical protein
MVVCTLCGATPEGEPDELPLRWCTSVEDGVTTVCCDVCAREYLRSIEAKLDPQWWR